MLMKIPKWWYYDRSQFSITVPIRMPGGMECHTLQILEDTIMPKLSASEFGRAVAIALSGFINSQQFIPFMPFYG